MLRKPKVFAVISSDHQEDDDFLSCHASHVPDRSLNPEQVYQKRQELEGLFNALERLPSSLRNVIYKFCEGEGTFRRPFKEAPQKLLVVPDP
jgi:DNA-directed RNA polymerase specialized sigma24 family protein